MDVTWTLPFSQYSSHSVVFVKKEQRSTTKTPPNILNHFIGYTLIFNGRKLMEQELYKHDNKIQLEGLFLMIITQFKSFRCQQSIYVINRMTP